MSRAPDFVPLAPIEWPFLTQIELPNGANVIETLLRSGDAAVDFLARALRERYLPPTVRFMLPAFVEPMTDVLSLKARAVVTGPLDAHLGQVLQEMARASAWNRDHQSSYYQRILQRYPESRATALICSSGPPLAAPVNGVQIAHLLYPDPPRNAPPPLPADFWTFANPYGNDQRHYRITLSEVGDAVRQARSTARRVGPPHDFPVKTVILSGTDRDAEFERFVHRDLESDTAYLAHISSLVALATVIVTVPRPFHVVGAGAASQLGASGLTLLLERDAVVTPDLVMRCVLLADRVTSFFSLAANVYRAAQRRGLRDAFEIVSHSLENAIEYVADGTPETAAATLLVERTTLHAAKLMGARNGGQESSALWCRKGVPFEQSILRALGRSGLTLTISAEPLHHTRIDKRFMAAAVELTRNMAKRSAAAGGAVEITRTPEGRLSLTAENRCAYSDYRRARDLLARHLPDGLSAASDRFQERGLLLFLGLIESISDQRSSLRIRVGCPNETFSRVITHTLRSRAQITMEAGESIAEAERIDEDHRSCELDFTFWLHTDNLRVDMREDWTDADSRY